MKKKCFAFLLLKSIQNIDKCVPVFDSRRAGSTGGLLARDASWFFFAANRCFDGDRELFEHRYRSRHLSVSVANLLNGG
jgi:hypothetical protein